VGREPADDVVAPDGSPVLLYRRLRPVGEPQVIAAAVAAGSTILELGAGAGRVTHALAALGYRVTAVDEEPAMLQWIQDAETVASDIETLDLGRRFDAVILGSHLVNVPDVALRSAFLGSAARHVSDEGSVLVEHHPIDWAATAEESWSTVDGIRLGLTDVLREPPFVSAVSVYQIDDKTFRQPFTAEVLSEAALAEALAGAGLRVARRLSPTWIEAVSSRRGAGTP
jgi:SAM-dependent methyltransferase